ncbi:MAG: glycine/sarcosine/betaine reductase selenoprotein B family protein [Syntrophales bacterium]|jgi:D-proline reductase (dithiol) PrdB
MDDLNELSLTTRLFLVAYPWRRIDPVPWTPLRKPLSQCRLALVSSAGFVLPGQPSFDVSIRGGDTSFRDIPSDVDVCTLVESHRSEAFDHSGMREDLNLVFPIDRVRELAAMGRIGSVNHRHLSCMGSITAPGRLIKKTAPAAVQKLVEDGVDIALLVPV